MRSMLCRSPKGRMSAPPSRALRRSPPSGTSETQSPEGGEAGAEAAPWCPSQQGVQATHSAFPLTAQCSPLMQNHHLGSLWLPQPRAPAAIALAPHTFTGLCDVNHFSLSRLYFLLLKRAPILPIILRMKKSCLFFWLRRWLNFSIYSCKRDISSRGFYPSSVYAHFK